MCVVYVYMCVCCIHEFACAIAQIWRSEDNFVERALSFNLFVGSGV